MVGIPEHLLRRAAEARARATGRPVEEVLAEMRQEVPPEQPAAARAAADQLETPEPVAAPTTPGPVDFAAAAATTGMPEHLLRRSVEAKSKATGLDVDTILREMIDDIPQRAPSKPPPSPPASPAPAAPGAPGGEIDWAAVAQSQGMSEKLFRRSVEAKAKKTGRSPEEVVAEITGQPAPTGAPSAAPSRSGAAPAAIPAAGAPVIPEGVRTQRLLTVVRSRSIQQIRKEPVDKVNVWPHLLAIEFVALLVVLAALIVFSIFQDAPLLELANPNEQPNPSKAPWYFLGLQELLSYFDPQIAGVLIPSLGLAALAIIPYIDRNPSVHPSDRKFAIMLFTFFVMGAAVLTIIGSFYRGPGFNFTYPWTDGIFFDL